MSNPYPHGQCTWGAAEMCPCLQNRGKYGNFGNGGDWFAHAKSIGLPISSTPVQGWLASFATTGWPDGPGDVGMIVSVNNDGTVTRYGTNWHLDQQWSTDPVKASLVIGCFKPPCDCSNPGTGTLFSTGTSNSTDQTNCRTFKWQWSLLGQNMTLCFDNLIGMFAVGGGLLLVAAGVFIMIASTGAIKDTGLVNTPVTQEEAKKEDQTEQTQPEQTEQTGELSSAAQKAIAVRARQRAKARTATARRQKAAAQKSGSSKDSVAATTNLNILLNQKKQSGGTK